MPDGWLQDFDKFWTIVVEVWNYGVLGISLGRLITAAAILIVFLVTRRLFIRVVMRRIKRWAEKTRTDIDNKIITALEQPLGLIPVGLGVFFAAEFLELDGTLQVIADHIVKSLIIIAIFWAFYRLVEPLSFLLKGLERMFSREMIEWLVKAIKFAFVFIGAAAVLETWGIQVAPLLAGLGIFGVAVALGAQDLFKNLIAGLLILAEKRFGNGDWIKVDGIVEGTVEKIGFRSTRIRRFDMAPVQVPNSKLSDEAVTNFSSMTYRRIYWTIGVEYRTSVDQLRQIRDQIEAYVTEGDTFVDPAVASTFVRIDAFSDSAIDIMLYCFTVTTNWGEWLQIKEELAYKIKEIVEGAGTGFAFPSRSLYVETLPGDQPEIFVPPES
ncbi:MAG: mechanosensitive ion channel domain-containing protein [Pseudomonadota bacterium]